MQYIYYIRSYQKFPSVIPVLRVSPLRVTHPSAMVPNIASYIFPINLHVLSILSAFILSQDQTLHSIYFSHIFFFSPFFSSFDRDFSLSLKTSSHLCFFFLFCFPLSSPTFAVDKNYITKFITFCQYLFLSFLPFFYPPFTPLSFHYSLYALYIFYSSLTKYYILFCFLISFFRFFLLFFFLVIF